MKKTTPQLLMDERVIKALSEIPKNMNGLFMLLEKRKAHREAKNKPAVELKELYNGE